MHGLFITNKYVNTDKFLILKNGFMKAAFDLNIKFEYLNNQMAYDLIDKKVQYDFVLFYDKDINLAENLELTGYKIYNNSKSISVCDDKYKTYLALKNEITQPYTLPSPFLYYGDLSNDNDFINECESTFTYPMIVKETKGSFGFQVYKIDNKKELVSCIKKISIRPFIVQEFIESSFGRDIRLQVIGENVVCAMQRINQNGDFRANVTNGATPYIYKPNIDEIKIALVAAKKIGVCFAGVDLLFGKDGSPVFCEINSNSHLDIISRVCKKNLYVEILKYIIGTIND